MAFAALLVTLGTSTNRALAADDALVAAVENEDVPAVAAILAGGGDPNVTNADGHGPLHAAATLDTSVLVRLLLAHGARIDARDNDGNTPLHLAAKAGRVENVRLLLASGANAQAKNNAGFLPAFLAIEHPQVTALLANVSNLTRTSRQSMTGDADFEAMQSRRYAEDGKGKFKRLRTVTLEDEDPAARAELIEELNAIGYASGSVTAPGYSGVTIHKRDKAWEGLNLWVSGHDAEAILMDMNGKPIHRWRADFHQVWPDHPIKGDDPDCYMWRRARVWPNGDLVAIHPDLGILKLDKNSNVIWAKPIPAHHDLDIAPSGEIYVLTRQWSVVPAVNPNKPVWDEFITILDENGDERGKISLFECLANAKPPMDSLWKQVKGGEGDLLHSNTIRLLDGAIAGVVPQFKKGNVLTSIREIDAIAVIDLDKEAIVWAHQGDYSKQHDPRITAGGRLLLFDNRGRPNRSSVQEYDPRTMTLQWVFRGSEKTPFYTYSCGASQRLPNGNVLIVESDNGRAFEVTRGGEIVWEYYNPHRAGDLDQYIASLFDMIRFPPDYFDLN